MNEHLWTELDYFGKIVCGHRQHRNGCFSFPTSLKMITDQAGVDSFNATTTIPIIENGNFSAMDGQGDCVNPYEV